jgi:hypothetical protein
MENKKPVQTRCTYHFIYGWPCASYLGNEFDRPNNSEICPTGRAGLKKISISLAYRNFPEDTTYELFRVSVIC